MPTLTIDENVIEFKQGQTIIQASKDAGIDIPHFCWHPALSVSGNCRICLVEVEKLPKLVIACSTAAAENMIVHTNNERVKRARNAVMEFLLINHPLDCPICDEAGECKLQDYAYKFSTRESRFDEEKVHMDKRIELGPNVMLDQERCINCSRCIRFCEEIAGEPQLTFVQRGENVRITTFPGKQLDNPYSMNVIDICPVGALTSRDFRFKARVWDMSSTESICIGCSRGCNINIWVRNNEILRLTPRENLEVNEYWMCDYGRLHTFKFVNDSETRVLSPMIRTLEQTDNSHHEYELHDCGWDEAIARVLTELRNYSSGNIGVIASPFSTLEENFVLKRFAHEVIGTKHICYIPKFEEQSEDDILIKADKTPNSAGLKFLGIHPVTQEFTDNIRNGKIKFLYILNDSFNRLNNADELSNYLEVAITHIHNFRQGSKRATVIFPLTTYAEMNGTFVNFKGSVQRINPAVVTLETERLPGDFSVSRLDKFGAPNDSWTQGDKYNSRPAWKVLTQISNALGVKFGYQTTSEIFDDIVKNIPAFSGMSYETFGSQGIQIGEKEISKV